LFWAVKKFCAVDEEKARIECCKASVLLLSRAPVTVYRVQWNNNI